MEVFGEIWLTIARASKELDLSLPTVTASLMHLVNLGIVRETSGKQRGRLYVYEAYMSILQQGTEPL